MASTINGGKGLQKRLHTIKTDVEREVACNTTVNKFLMLTRGREPKSA